MRRGVVTTMIKLYKYKHVCVVKLIILEIYINTNNTIGIFCHSGSTPNCGVLRPQIFSLVTIKCPVGLPCLTILSRFVILDLTYANWMSSHAVCFFMARDYNISEVPKSLFVSGVHYNLLWPKAQTFEKSQNRKKMVTVPIRPSLQIKPWYYFFYWQI